MPVPSRTLWYMGVKTRVLDGLLAGVLEREVPPGGTVVDLMSGTGVVAAHCADGCKVYANDVEDYAAVIARSLIEHDPSRKAAFLRSVRLQKDLGPAFHRNLDTLGAFYERPLAREAQLLGAFEDGRRGRSWCRAYREFLESPGSVYGAAAGPADARSLYAGARSLLTEESIERYREDPERAPACLVTAYYANIYFGLRQAIVLDSLRAAIEALPGRGRFAAAKKAHYLSALLHAASVSTSGTSHFAQPRHTVKDSELFAMATRRGADVFARFEESSRDILDTVAAIRHRPGNQCFSGDYKHFLEGDGGGFRFPGKVHLVYFDPPYTADNYSRFYHVLNVLARYDYPPLDRDAGGRVLRGRYPRRERRFMSGFCSKVEVEDEFRRVIHASAAAGAKLVISYASPTGLLLKCYRSRFPRRDAVKLLEDLCREDYRDVETLRLPLRHSGQGDSTIPVTELVVVCRRPREKGARHLIIGDL